jgi:hypothetical protein
LKKNKTKGNAGWHVKIPVFMNMGLATRHRLPVSERYSNQHHKPMHFSSSYSLYATRQSHHRKEEKVIKINTKDMTVKTLRRKIKVTSCKTETDVLIKHVQ